MTSWAVPELAPSPVRAMLTAPAPHSIAYSTISVIRKATETATSWVT